MTNYERILADMTLEKMAELRIVCEKVLNELDGSCEYEYFGDYRGFCYDLDSAMECEMRWLEMEEKLK